MMYFCSVSCVIIFVLAVVLNKVLATHRNVSRPPKRLDCLYGYFPGVGSALSRHTPQYKTVEISKRSGGKRILHIPDRETKKLQRTMLNNLLNRLPVHSSVTGFRQGKSIVDNAAPHVGREVIVKLDIKEFFPSTSVERVQNAFQGAGFDWKSAEILVKLSCFEGGLPQGAPTSPAISNYVNKNMDRRLELAARKVGAVYTRYADDITYSLASYSRKHVHHLLQVTGLILKKYGYQLNNSKKRIIRAHRQQRVTGLVVNERVNLPRTTRRWLRAVYHRLRTGGDATLSSAQFAGWMSLLAMVDESSRLLEEVYSSGMIGRPKRLDGEDVLTSENHLSQNAAAVASPSGQETTSAGMNQSTLEPLSDTAVPTEIEPVVESPKTAPQGLRTPAESFGGVLERIQATEKYSAQRKLELAKLEGQEFELMAEFREISRTFSFSLPQSYQEGRTLKGTLVTEGVDLEVYCRQEETEALEGLQFPCTARVKIRVHHWNQIFKRIEALLVQWRDD
ncbi:MAG: reverse transcriptase family protein [Planctomycetota bacterium]|nr:reverse transcriptase family protein [Planctomycetota bacterium]